MCEFVEEMFNEPFPDRTPREAWYAFDQVCDDFSSSIEPCNETLNAFESPVMFIEPMDLLVVELPCDLVVIPPEDPLSEFETLPREIAS